MDDTPTETGAFIVIPSMETGAVAAVIGSALVDAPDAMMTQSGSLVGSGAAMLPSVVPATPVRIVVSEVMWMGSTVSTADEWVEIAAFSSGSVSFPLSVSGWTLVSVKAGVESVLARLPDRSLSSGATLVIANAHAESSRLLLEPDVVTTAMSLPNTQLLLRLKNASGAVVDEVDDGVGVPMAGANPSGGIKASMERVDPWNSGNIVSSWKTAALSIGFDDGPSILGTPGTLSAPSAPIVDPVSAPSPSIPPDPPVGVPIVPVQAPPVVRLTEVLANPIGADTDEWLEIGSFDPLSVDLSEMELRMGTSRFALSGMLEPGEHRRFGKLATGLALPNSSGTPELLWRGKLIDAWTYGETAEGVSLGRSLEGVVGPQCVPSPDMPNTGAPLDPFIRIQSSSASSGKASFNLEAAVAAGSMAGATCAWTYPDGFVSASCNPPSHSMAGPVYGDVILTMQDYCGNTMIRFLRTEVPGKTGPKDDDPFICMPTAFTGVTVSEIFPNPVADEETGEWIELANPTSVEKSLCGWSIDDEDGGSDPYRLDHWRLPAGERLVFERSDTDVAFNNDGDAVHLFSPLPIGGSGAYEIVRYTKSPEGKTFSRRGDGVWLWTDPTPGKENVFEPVRRSLSVDARIVQAMPNPGGDDRDGGEWIELRNETPYPLPLTGWSLETASESHVFGSFILPPRETVRIDDVIPLANTTTFVRLRDREGVDISTLAWHKSDEGRSVRVPMPVADVSDLSFISSDDCVLWAASFPDGSPVSVTIRGVKTEKIQECSTFVSALLKKEKFEQEIYSSWSGSTVLFHGTDIATILLREGLAMVDDDDVTPFDALYRLYEEQARTERRGMWANEEVAILADEHRSTQQQRTILEEKGLVVSVSPPAGVVTAGTMVTVSTNVDATVQVSTGADAWQSYDGPLVIDVETILLVRAVANTQTSTGMLVSSNLVQPYYMLKSRYPKVRLSEVYPSPKTGESEWVELWNPTDESVPLVGWLLDDVEGSGSKPARLPDDAVLAPGERRVFSGSSIAWNNGGDSVRLIAPNGKVSHALTYPSLKKGSAFAVMFASTGKPIGDCPTVHPTPGGVNRCAHAIVVPKKKSPTPRASPAPHDLRYRNIVASDVRSFEPRPLFDALFASVSRRPSPLSIVVQFAVMVGICAVFGGAVGIYSRRT